MEIYQVGGSVRDEILGHKPIDKDWVVVGSSPEEMEAKGFIPIGKDFPVFLHPTSNEEYALARTEKKIAKGYKGFKFYCSPDITLEEDLIRRDLTINSIAKDSNGKIIDPCNGSKDIAKKIFRNTSDAFNEDPLRAIRVARFSSYKKLHDFKISNSLYEAIEEIVSKDELNTLSAERVFAESQKAMQNQYSSNFFENIIRLNLKDPWFKNLEKVPFLNAKSVNHKWLQLELGNDFKITKILPASTKLQSEIKVFMNLIEISNCNEHDTLTKKILELHPERHLELIKGLQYEFDSTLKVKKIEKIIENYMRIDFKDLSKLSHDEIIKAKISRVSRMLNEL